MKRTLIVTSVVVVISIVALVVFLRLTHDRENLEFAEVRNGYFEISVDATGEIIAENSVDIKGPNLVGNRRFRASPIRIMDLVPEGSEVRKGDFVAELDRSSYVNSLRDEQELLRVEQNNYETKVLDTAVVLSQLRDEAKNQEFEYAEAQVKLDQSKFEPPAIQRQAEISLDKAKRTLVQKRKQYDLKRAQLRAELLSQKLKVNTQQRSVEELEAMLASFSVKAPADGMVIYKRDRMGQKIVSGSSMNPWDPVVATLPDLSTMLSKIYVSEIEINKVKYGLPVELTIDAFPDRYFTGLVQTIANIGEKLPNSDSKVFEVHVLIEENNPMLRPSMTTSNRIIVKRYHDVMFVPNESVHAGADSIPFVYTRSGTRQVVVLGESNGKNIIVEKGLDEGTQVWLSVPENAEKFSLAGTELIPVIRERARELARLETERLMKYSMRNGSVPSPAGSQSGMGSPVRSN